MGATPLTVAPAVLAAAQVVAPLGPQQEGPPTEGPTPLNVLYIFAGLQRKADVHHFLLQKCSAAGHDLKMDEVDIVRNPQAGDVRNDAVWVPLLQLVATGHYFCVICTPPCNPWSRAPWANSAGPRPVRSREHPWGFPWLEGHAAAKCAAGSDFVRKTWEVCSAAHKAGCFFLVEHPEDLGITPSGGQPASIWQLEGTLELAHTSGAFTAALHQCSFGTDFPKPTRFLSNLRAILRLSCTGWPQFDAQGNYSGPLPRRCGHNHRTKIIGRSSSGGFASSPSAAYPPQLCDWIAQAIWDQWASFGLLKKGRTRAETQLPVPAPAHPQEAGSEASPPTSEDDEEGVRRPRPGQHPGGQGPPVQAVWAGKRRELHDGAGLCSPGRWPPGRRAEPGRLARRLREGLLKILLAHIRDPHRVVYALACSHFKASPFTDDLLGEARAFWFRVLAEEGGVPVEELELMPEYQPFYLRALAETLRIFGDPDWRVFWESKESFAKGVPVGVDVRLPRTPAVFERKRRWRRYDDSEPVLEKENYKSILGNEAQIRAQFEEEKALGMMFDVPDRTAHEQYPGDRLRVAAQGALEKGDNSFRVIHDGTHGVRVNNAIKPRDQVRMPTAGDIRAVLREGADTGEVHFLLKGDVAKAHRRTRVRQEDWGLAACRLQPGTIWLNRVGTFGIGSAGYWWARLAGGVARAALHLAGRDCLWQLIYSDDLLWIGAGHQKLVNILLVVFFWALAGTPFSWKKFRGGLAADWIGYYLDASRFSVGLNAGRRAWLAEWLGGVVAAKMVLVRGLLEGLGRLTFASGVMEWTKPLFAPVYAWVASVPGGACLVLPPMIRLVLTWLRDQLLEGRADTTCRRPQVELGEVFKADAKGEQDYMVLGGWECRGGVPTSAARWFALRIERQEAPWLFRQHGSQTIATGELMATLACVMAFVPPGGNLDAGGVALSGSTDNLGNSYAVAKLLTTKWPLILILMGLAETLADRGCWLSLAWTPRESNCEADALTNADYQGFDPTRRVEVTLADLCKGAVTRYLEAGRELYEGIGAAREARRHREAGAAGGTLSARRGSTRKRARVLGPW